jgi:hypothetical protein
MEITLFRGARDVAPSNQTVTWPFLCDFALEMMRQERRRTDKLQHDALIFGRCEGSRANANVRFLSGLAADFDVAPDRAGYVSFDQRCADLASQGLAFIAYTTTKNARAHNKYRLLLPYDSDVRIDLCRSAWAACNAKLGGTIDKSTKDPARLSFLPATWTGNPFWDAGRSESCRLDGPFNDIRVASTGEPILTAPEIAELCPWNPFEAAKQAKSGVSGDRVLTDVERNTLAHGHSLESPLWALLAALDCSPLTCPWMLKQLPHEEGNRDFRFMCAVAKRAVTQNLPINAETIIVLADQFSRKLLHREPPPDAARQAENALSRALDYLAEQQATPCQPDAGNHP